MSFTGTLDKCKACDKTVYFLDLLSVDGVPYHKTCFKCSHCKGTLVMSNYSSMDGVLYCKPHFEQLFKESGDFSKKFQTGQKKETYDGSKAPNKMSSLFTGTQDKCATCGKTVYPLEKISLEGVEYHKTCFKCAAGGCPLTHSSYAALDGVLYCRHHFGQLFMEKGTYSHILEAAKKKNQEGDTQQAEEATAGEEEAGTEGAAEEVAAEEEGAAADEGEAEDNAADPDHGPDHSTERKAVEEDHNQE